MEILAVSQNQLLLMQSLMTRIETRFDALESNLSVSNPESALEAATEFHDPTVSSDYEPPIQPPPPQQQRCSRYCKCQCHRTTAVRAPSWMKSVTGSLVVQYSGGLWFRTGSCNKLVCQREPKSVFQVGYSFPAWFLSRAVFLSASWGLLTNAGASLHLTVPRVCEPVGTVRAIIECRIDFFKARLSRRELMPTDLTHRGGGYLAVSIPIWHPRS